MALICARPAPAHFSLIPETQIFWRHDEEIFFQRVSREDHLDAGDRRTCIITLEIIKAGCTENDQVI